ncbi:hypothetical protein BC941DRAFT_509972 [Chlamydoabsidia padenii]|nr:hypothetical protein BC941DRAFT_509972 [Chlamydoabsidia padenii]
MVLNEWFWYGIIVIVFAYIYFDRKAQAVDDAKAKKYQQMKASAGTGTINDVSQ